MKLIRIAALAVLLALCAFSQTTITDTIYEQPGQLWTGTISFTWDAFTTADGRQIGKGSQSVAVSSGALTTRLWPNDGATPGVAYIATYTTTSGPNRGTQWVETWLVKASPSIAALQDVRKASTLANTIRSGTTTPDNTIGANGDFYLKTDTMCLYGPKANNAWAGGCQGLMGPPGIMLSGSGAPSPGSGTPGQFYLDTVASCLYGPYDNVTGWPGSCQSLVGPPGPISSVFGRTTSAITAQSGDYNTSQITESGNLYFTTGRVLSAMAGLYQTPIAGAPGTWPSTFPPATHTHVASDVTSGVFTYSRLGTGGDGSGTHVLYDNGTFGTPPSSGGGGAWGSITGTLSAQADLATALSGKAPATSGTAPLKGNGSGGTSTATSGDIASLFSGCSGTKYLGADGACHTASGGNVTWAGGAVTWN